MVVGVPEKYPIFLSRGSEAKGFLESHRQAFIETTQTESPFPH
jgi:hypothetical protein